MNDPKAPYKKPGQMLAIHGKDAEIYPYLSSSNQSDFKPDRPARQQMCHFVYAYQEGLQSNYHQRPENLPFTRNDLQAFLDEGLKQFEGGYWSVYWASDARLIGRDTIYPDGYRSVVSFRTVEFMIRPMPDYRDRSDDGREEPKRLYVGCLDVKACLSQALRANRPGPMRTFTGMAHMNHPDRDGTREAMVGKAEITFEWRFDRVLPDKMDAIVRKWRYDQFGTAEKYHDEMKKVYDQRARETLDQESQARDPAPAQPGALLQGHPPPGQPQQGPSQFPLIPVHHRGKVTSRRGKRKTSDIIASQDVSPSIKRRSIGSQSSSSSQSEFAPQSLTASPEMGWQTAVGGWPQRDMPPPPNPQSSVGSQSGRSSQSGFASQSDMSSLGTGQQTPTGAQPQTAMLPPQYPPYQRSVSSRSSRSSRSGQSSAYSPEMGRQTPVDTWQRREMPPPASPRFAEPSYADQGYGPSLPAASPRQVQPHPPAPMQNVPPPGSGFARGQPGGAPNPYWPQAPPTPGSYSLGTGNYSPRMPPDTWGRGSNAPSPSFPPPAMPAPDGDVFRYQVPTASSPGGPSHATGPSYQRPVVAAPGANVVPYQVPPASSDPEWFGSAGRYMHSSDPQDWDQSGYQDQYGGGRGSGRR